MRREALEEIDPGWCPAWDVGWQRAFRLVQAHVREGGAVPTVVGELVVQGEVLGRWVMAQRFGWQPLVPAQQWLLENVLDLEPAGEEERPVQRTQDDKWALNLAAARQYHAREGHLNAPRKHVEELAAAEARRGVAGRVDSADGVITVKLGMFIDKHTPPRRQVERATTRRPRLLQHALVRRACGRPSTAVGDGQAGLPGG